jgi:hypothetical protein
MDRMAGKGTNFSTMKLDQRLAADAARIGPTSLALPETPSTISLNPSEAGWL